VFLQVMVNVQMLSELEEVIQFKLVPERREVIREMWWNRLRVLPLTYLLVYLLNFSANLQRWLGSDGGTGQGRC